MKNSPKKKDFEKFVGCDASRSVCGILYAEIYAAWHSSLCHSHRAQSTAGQSAQGTFFSVLCAFLLIRRREQPELSALCVREQRRRCQHMRESTSEWERELFMLSSCSCVKGGFLPLPRQSFVWRGLSFQRRQACLTFSSFLQGCSVGRGNPCGKVRGASIVFSLLSNLF